MRREMIDPKSLELSDKVVAIKRVSKTVKDVPCVSRLWSL